MHRRFSPYRAMPLILPQPAEKSLATLPTTARLLSFARWACPWAVTVRAR